MRVGVVITRVCVLKDAFLRTVNVSPERKVADVNI